MALFPITAILCPIGATLRYLAYSVSADKSSKKPFSSYINYKDNYETEFIDSVLGAVALFFALWLLIEVVG